MTLRAFIIGLLLAIFANFWTAYSSLVLHSSRADFSHLSLAMLIPFVGILAFNQIRLLQKWALSPSELLTICSLGMIAALMQGEWLSSYFLGVITAPTYFATPENRWTDLLVDNLAPWAIVSNSHATRGFYEGIVQGAPLPWQDWSPPLFWWGCFFATILCINLCISVILRRQWMEHERLGYPIATALLSPPLFSISSPRHMNHMSIPGKPDLIDNHTNCGTEHVGHHHPQKKWRQRAIPLQPTHT